MVKPLESTRYHNSRKLWILLPLRAIYFRQGQLLDHFTIRHPVTPNNLNPHSLVCTKSSFLKKERVKMHCSKKKTVSLCINIIIPPFLFLSTILQAGCPPPPSRCTFWRKYFLWSIVFSSPKTFNKLFISSESLRFTQIC